MTWYQTFLCACLPSPTRIRLFLGQDTVLFVFKSWLPPSIGVISLIFPNLGFLICKMGMIETVCTSQYCLKISACWMSYAMNEVHFLSIFILFQEVQAGWSQCYQTGIVCSGLSSVRSSSREGLVTFLDLPAHHSPTWVLTCWELGRGGETPCCWEAAFKVFRTKGKEPESKITLFFGVYHWLLSPSNKALSSEVL